MRRERPRVFSNRNTGQGVDEIIALSAFAYQVNVGSGGLDPSLS